MNKICLSSVWLLTMVFLTPVIGQGQVPPAYQEAGLPYIQNFGPRDYGAPSQNWGILQDKRGLMYFGNSAGILEFDGVSWRLIPVANSSLVGSLAMDHHGRIYVGAQRPEFGYLSPDSVGRLQYVSLLEHVPDADQDFTEVYDVVATSHGVYFSTDYHLLRWHGGQIKVWTLEESPILYGDRDTLLAWIQGTGLTKLVGDSLELVPDGERFAEEAIYDILPFPSAPSRTHHTRLVTTRSGFYLYDGRAFERFRTEADAFLQENQLNHSAELADGTFALATERGGVAIIDREGRLRRIIDKSSGLRDKVTYAVYPDRQGGLWLALANGIARMEIPSPISLYSDPLGMESNVLGFVRHRGRLYAAADFGVLYLQTAADEKPPMFQPVSGIASMAWSLISLERTLLAGTVTGVYHIENDKATLIDGADMNVRFLHRSRRYPNRVYVGHMGGVEMVEKSNGQWQFAGRVPGIEAEVRTIVEDEDGMLWVGVRDSVFRIPSSSLAGPFPDKDTLIQIERYGPSHGLSKGQNAVFPFKGGVILATNGGIRRFDPASQTFPPDSTFGPMFADTTRWIERIAEDQRGRVWIIYKGDDGREIGVATPEGETYTWTSLPYRRLAEFSDIYALYPEARPGDESGVVWLGGVDGIARIDNSISRDHAVDFPALIRTVTVKGDSIIFRGAGLMAPDSLGTAGDSTLALQPFVPALPFSRNSMAFEFAAPTYDGRSSNRFQYFLEGFDEGWSEWSKESKKEYTNLAEGSYRFKVRAKNIYGHTSTGSAFSFRILSPWYRTWWAYVMYLLLGGGLVTVAIVGYARYRTREQAKALDKEREINERLRRVDKLKDEFLANTSHELRTPLNGIIGLAESLIDGAGGKLPPKASANLSMVVSSGKRLASLVNDILDFSRLKSHDLALQRKPVDIRVLTEVVLKLSESLATGKALELKNEIPENIVPVDGDENRLQQIMHNLIGNAVKFTPSGSVRVSAAEKDGMVAVTVSDTGIGIPKGNQQSIFQSFEQVDASTAREYGGTGLGLAVTKQLVELHGGAIRVDSEVDKGSTLTFTIPVSEGSVPSPSATLGKGPREEPQSQTAASDLAQVREIAPAPAATVQMEPNGTEGAISVLVVDDEPVNQQVLANHLSFVNYSVTQAYNGEEALKAVESGEKFDLVLLDIMMPKMSGYEVCQKIRESHLPGELPVIMVTAKNQVSDLLDGFTSGANDYIAKPFIKDELLARMKTQLNLSKISTAYGRFVPHEFLRSLGQESILDVKLGDHVHGEMTILFSDIRSYTTLSESMSPEENFKFLNAYLSRIGPKIRACNGFVNQFQGDGIMALFLGQAENAVSASIEMQKAVSEYNDYRQTKDRTPIQIGIGLHTGPLMLGIMGDRDRMDANVVSDAVNIASRMEGLTKFYGASIAVSEDTFSHLAEAGKFNHRFLGKVQVKGKQQPISVFEITDGDSREISDLKGRTKTDFEAGLNHYFAREFAEASVCFKNVLRTNAADKTAKLYLERSAQFMVQGVPEDWEGVEAMSNK